MQKYLHTRKCLQICRFENFTLKSGDTSKKYALYASSIIQNIIKKREVSPKKRHLETHRRHLVKISLLLRDLPSNTQVSLVFVLKTPKSANLETLAMQNTAWNVSTSGFIGTFFNNEVSPSVSSIIFLSTKHPAEVSLNLETLPYMEAATWQF